VSTGSERFAFVQYPDTPRVCAACGRALRVVDVARIHTVIDYSSGSGKVSSVFYCVEDMHEGYGFLRTALARDPRSRLSLPARGNA